MMEKERSCGDCKVCCWAPAIEELKDAGEWCPNCDVKASLGCKIYEDRPADCATFQCAYIHNPDLVPASLFPKDAHVMITYLVGKGGLGFVVWEQLPGAAKKKPVQRWIKAMKLKGHRMVVANPRRMTREHV